jgi:hypothetical protein
VTGKLLVRPAGGPDRAWLLETITRRWGAPVVVSRGRAHDVACLPAIVAELGGQRVGLATYLNEGGEAELDNAPCCWG